MSLKIDWKIGHKHQAPFVTIGSHFREGIEICVGEDNVDILDLFPLKNNWKIEGYTDDRWLAFTINETRGQIPSVGLYNEDKVACLKEKILPYKPRKFDELYAILGDDWYSFDKFTYVGPYNSPYACWQDLVCFHIHYWLSEFVAPEVERRNRTRILRAIPEPPLFNIDTINACWVLECETDMLQGTAFSLDGVGLVSCAHVLGSNTVAFKANTPYEKFPVKVLKKNDTIDIAILEIDHDHSIKLSSCSADNLDLMDHISVAGFPNYRLGDTGVIIPGLTIGFRMNSGIRRILTNASIVAGNSGGPVINSQNKVIGIAVTGAERMEDAQKTENHGIIPIDALNYLD